MKVIYDGKKATIHTTLGVIKPGENNFQDSPLLQEMITKKFFRVPSGEEVVELEVEEAALGDTPSNVDAISILKSITKSKRRKRKKKAVATENMEE